MTTTPSISDALSKLWTRFLPEIENRLALLQVAADALASGSLGTGQREAAHAAAHKLAGTLGTFGLPQGTDLARQAELLLAGDVPDSAAPQLLSWVAELQSVIRSRT
jgi:HPt (histidine-containing phosphotransfer) domain-containing protein